MILIKIRLKKFYLSYKIFLSYNFKGNGGNYGKLF